MDSDLWCFLRPENDDEVLDDRGPEDRAMHARRRVTSVEELEVERGAPELDEAPLALYDDEVGDEPSDPVGSDHEPDLVELLASQHYTFLPEPDA